MIALAALAAVACSGDDPAATATAAPATATNPRTGSTNVIRDLDTGGVTQPISFSETNHRGMRSMRIYEVRDGKWEPVSGFLSAV